jgi:hypothetical protein
MPSSARLCSTASATGASVRECDEGSTNGGAAAALPHAV